jgi:hypothetical protein
MGSVLPISLLPVLLVQRGNLLVSNLDADDEYLAVRETRRFMIDYADVLNFTAHTWGRVILLLYYYDGGVRYMSKVAKARAAEKAQQAEERTRAERARAAKKGVKKSSMGDIKGQTTVAGGTGVLNPGHNTVTNASNPSGSSSSSGCSSSSSSSSSTKIKNKASSDEPWGATIDSIFSDDDESEGGGEKTDSAEADQVITNGGYVVEAHGQHYIVRVPHDFKTRHLLEFLGDALPPAKMCLPEVGITQMNSMEG